MLILVTLWGVVSFWQLNQILAVNIAILVLGIFTIIFTILEIAPLFLLIFLSFISSYALYGFLFQYNLPIWLIMLGLIIVFGYIYLYVEQKIGILGNKRLIYLILFCLIALEVFLSLSYFLINPLSKSLIIGVVSYLFVGFSYTVLAKQESKLSTYLIVAVIMGGLIFLTSSWGGSI